MPSRICILFACVLVLAAMTKFAECESKRMVSDTNDLKKFERRQDCSCDVACCDASFCCSQESPPSWCTGGPCG